MEHPLITKIKPYLHLSVDEICVQSGLAKYEVTKALTWMEKERTDLLATHTVLIKQLEADVLYWKKAHLDLQQRVAQLEIKMKEKNQDDE